MTFGLPWSPNANRLIPLAMLVCGFVWGTPFSSAEKDETTTITSRTMTAEGKSQRAIFEGKVVLTKGELVIRSDRMIVTFKKKDQRDHDQHVEEETTNQVQHIAASGNVIIEKSDGKATCGRAVYHKDEEKIVLTESPVAWQKGTKVTGSRMTMFIKEDRSIVEGGSRVILDDQGQ